MEKCNEYFELISASLDGALTPQEAARLEAHLKECPECRKLKAELEAVHAALLDLPTVEPPAGLTDRILAAVAADKVVPFAPQKSPIRWQRWAAAAALFAVVLAGYGSLRGPTKGAPGNDAPRSAEVSIQATGVAESLPQTRTMAPDEADEDVQDLSDRVEMTADLNGAAVSPASTPDSPVQNSISPRETEAPARKAAPATGGEEIPEPQPTLTVRSFMVTAAMAPNEEGEEETVEGDGLDAALFVAPVNESAPIMEIAALEENEEDPQEENQALPGGVMTAREALDLVVEYIFEYRGIPEDLEREDADGENGCLTCTLRWTDEDVRYNASLLYSGENELEPDIYHFACDWGDGQPVAYLVNKADGSVSCICLD